MSVEKIKEEFVGSGNPYEELKTEAQKLAERARVLDEEKERASRSGDDRRAKSLEEEHKRTMGAQREILRRIGKLTPLSLKK